MLRRLIPILAAVALSGCFNFDAAYEQYCDAGNCGGGAGGGMGGGGGTGGGGGDVDAGTGGGLGGGAGGGLGGGTGGGLGGGMGGGGGGLDAGTDGGTDGGTDAGMDAGTIDAGCQQFLCPELDWKSTQTSGEYYVAPAIMSQSLGNFRVAAAFRHGGSTASYLQMEYRFEDGGVTELNRTSMLDSRVEVRQLRGVSMDNYWFTVRTYAAHFDDITTQQDYYGRCTLPDGGLTDPWHWAVAPISVDEAWLVGYPMSICHWSASGGLTTVVDPTPWPQVRLHDVYVTPDGGIYAVGGDMNASYDSTCVVFREDGTQVSVPPLLDTYYGDGCSSVGGVGDTIYMVERSDSNNRGQILKLGPDGGFDTVYNAPFRLSQLNVRPSGEVWAVGQSPSRAVYFDGGSWGVVVLATTNTRTQVRWEGVDTVDDGLILSGFETQADGGNAAVVNTYRFFGH